MTVPVADALLVPVARIEGCVLACLIDASTGMVIAAMQDEGSINLPAAAGATAIVAVIGTSGLNVGMLQYQVREIISRISVHAADLGKWPTVAAAGKSRSRSDGDQASPRPLPTRRPSTR